MKRILYSAAALTQQFFKTFLKFCFPNSPGVGGEGDGGGRGRKGGAKRGRAKNTPKDSQFYVKLQQDDVEIAHQRVELAQDPRLLRMGPAPTGQRHGPTQRHIAGDMGAKIIRCGLQRLAKGGDEAFRAQNVEAAVHVAEIEIGRAAGLHTDKEHDKKPSCNQD